MARPALARRAVGPIPVLTAVVLAAVALAGCAPATPAASTGTTAASTGASAGAGAGPGGATVTKITDGDTIHVRIDGAAKDTTVRLIGIDTPETKRPNTPVECFGTEASAHMRELLPVGTRVRLEPDVEPTDRYGRTLAYVFRADDDLFVNRAQVEDGYAAPYRYPPNVAHADELSEAGRRARERGAGLWGACDGPHTTASRPPPTR